MNPNAFSFQPGAQPFVPRFAGPPPGQEGQPQQSGFNQHPPFPPYQQPFQQPYQQPQQPQFYQRPPAPADDWENDAPAPKSFSIGSSEPKTISLGASKPAKATPPTSGTSTPIKKPSTPAPSSQGTQAKPATPPQAKPAADKGIAVDTVQQQLAAAKIDDETLEDLYGPQAGDDKVNGKEHVNVVFIGHVDAGKSTMGGQILYLSDMVDKRTMEKYEKEAKDAGRDSWALSYALDSTPQERAKGKTVEVGRAYFETSTRRYTILDAPGHKNFVPSMISGASQADVAVLVISARKGEFETGFERGGQTREHAVLVKTAGVQKLVVVINKMDDATVEWSKDRYDEITGKLLPFLKQTGFNPKTDIHFVPVSAFTGLNIKEPVGSKCPYYTGPPLLRLFDEIPLLDRKLNAPLMMPISEKYKDLGCVIVGKIEAGRVRKGDQAIIMPNKNLIEIAGIESEQGEEMPLAQSGDNVRIRVKGIEDEEVMVGFVLTDVRRPVHAVRQFEAQLAILDHKNIICAGYSAVMHVHTAAEEITLNALLHYYDKKTGRKSKRPPPFAKKGQRIVALIEAANPLCMETFTNHAQLGRFTVRDEGKTIAIGKVTKLIESNEDMEKAASQTAAANSSA